MMNLLISPKPKSRLHELRRPAREDPQLVELLQRVRDHSDVLALADPAHPGFAVASSDDDRRIELSTMPVDTCPIHMMRARAVMPCAPRDFLEYLELDHRAKWDEHYCEGAVVDQIDAHTQLKYMAFRAPVRFLRDRDFEIAVSERWDEAAQTAVLKAISTAPGMLMPPDANGKMVRGSILQSGFIVKPARVADLPSELRHVGAACEVTYIALVHPRGRLHPTIVNLVIGKQTATLRGLQEFVAAHPEVWQAKRAATAASAPAAKSKL